MGLKQKARLDMSAKGLKVARIATARVQSKFESFFYLEVYIFKETHSLIIV